MSTYVVGDVQGCFLTLMHLLERVAFDPPRDRLWLVGDIVNRGPRSLETLRWASRQPEAHLLCVLGNHDLYLLGRRLAAVPRKVRDSVGEVLEAPDCDELLDWLRTRPFLHREGDHVLVHAGLHPAWEIAEADALAREAEGVLRGGEAASALACLHEKQPPAWDQGLDGPRRFAAIAGIFSRMRTCSLAGRPCYGFAGRPQAAPPGCHPWFGIPGRKSAASTVLFGHWAALGLHIEAGVVGLDSGCVYGGRLSAYRLEDRQVFQEKSADVT